MCLPTNRWSNSTHFGVSWPTSIYGLSMGTSWCCWQPAWTWDLDLHKDFLFILCCRYDLLVQQVVGAICMNTTILLSALYFIVHISRYIKIHFESVSDHCFILYVSWNSFLCHVIAKIWSYYMWKWNEFSDLCPPDLFIVFIPIKNWWFL